MLTWAASIQSWKEWLSRATATFVLFQSEQGQSPHYRLSQQPHHNRYTGAFINSICLRSHTEQLRGTVSSTQAKDVVIACTEGFLFLSDTEVRLLIQSKHALSAQDKWTWFNVFVLAIALQMHTTGQSAQTHVLGQNRTRARRQTSSNVLRKAVGYISCLQSLFSAKHNQCVVQFVHRF